jgi:ubiquinone/menaquinone biosynthesis C-methylase UbiE
MTMKKQQQNWDSVAETDAFWGILSLDGTKGGKWDIKEFFLTGEKEIDGLLQRIQSLGIALKWGTALDFGCGVGRLTQAAAKHFEKCCGVDISPKMVEMANQYNTHGEKCRYVLNSVDNLAVFTDDSFDLVYSKIALQHIARKNDIEKYIAEFIRTVKPGGLVAIQLISYLPLMLRLQPRRRLYDGLHALGFKDKFLFRVFNVFPVSLTAVPEKELVRYIESKQGVVKQIDRTKFKNGIVHSLYFISK